MIFLWVYLGVAGFILLVGSFLVGLFPDAFLEVGEDKTDVIVTGVLFAMGWPLVAVIGGLVIIIGGPYWFGAWIRGRLTAKQV